MAISCPQCHAEMPDNAAFCPGCGRRMWIPGQEARKPKTILPPPHTSPVNTPVGAPAANIPSQRKDNFVAALAYTTFIPAVIFVLIEPYKHNRFVRFHSFQSIFLAVAAVLMAIAMRILYSVLALIPVAGFLLAWLVTAVAVMGWVILWLVLLIKALQGEAFRLPWIGNLAEKA
jgi:uncharacterized membrane protein